jgi:sec-independent protein translocase protein TatC
MAASDVESEVQSGPVGTLPNASANPTPEADDSAGGTMTLVEHLEELRKRLFISLIAIVVATVVSFIFWHQILQFLLTPLPHISSRLTNNPNQKLVQHDILEAFGIAIKLSLAAGIALASPILLYQVWAYISPGLTKKERRYAAPFTILGSGLFIAGLAVGFVVLRYPVAWLINFGHKDFLLLLDANSYFTFVAYFMLAFGVVFELPMVLTALGAVGIIRSQTLRQKRKFILFGLWFLATIITPGADPISPLIIGVAMTVLFEFSIILLRILHK